MYDGYGVFSVVVVCVVLVEGVVDFMVDEVVVVVG